MNTSRGMPSPMPGMPGMPGPMPGAMPGANMGSSTSTMKGGKRGTRSKHHSHRGGRRHNNSTTTRSKNHRHEGGAKMPAVGSKASVYHGHAKHTSGGLTRKDLMKTKHGRIVSRKKHALGKKAIRRLVKAGYKAKKGTFKLFRK